MVIPQARSFYIEKGKEACVLVHGLSGSPSELRPLGDYLAESGFTIYAPLLPGHGTFPEDLDHTTWQDWYSCLEKAVFQMSEKNDRVYLIGLSMGGVLSLLGAARRLPLEKIVVLAAPIFFKDKKIYAVPILQHFIPYYNKKKNKGRFEKEDSKRFSYEKFSLKVISEFLQLIKVSKKELSKVEIPLMVVQSKNDKVVHMKSCCYIYHKTSSKLKKMLVLEKSGHIIPMSKEAPEVFHKIYNFLKD